MPWVNKDGVLVLSETGNSLWVAWADDASGTGFTNTPGTKDYMAWLARDNDEADPVAADYEGRWFKITGPAGTAGTSSFMYVAWADDNVGTGFTTTPADKAYLAILITATAIASPVAGDFTGRWFKVQGPAGDGSGTPAAHASSHATGGTDPVTPAAIGAAATSHTHADYVPVTRTVNGQALSANITLDAEDVGAAVASHSHADYVPTTRTVNGHALSANITLDAEDVGAASLVNGVMPTSQLPEAKKFPDTAILLHLDGPDINDDSDNELSGITASGGAVLSSAQKKFGAKSAYFDGTGAMLTLPDSDALNMGDDNFTIDFWFYATTTASVNYPSLFTNSATSWTYGAFCILYDNKVLSTRYRVSVAWYDVNTGYQIIESDTLTTNAFHHVALVRNGTTLSLYVDGTIAGSAVTIPAALTLDLRSSTIGASALNGTNSWYLGYIDELRISNVARWTSGFTAPSTAYSPANGYSGIVTPLLKYEVNRQEAYRRTMAEPNLIVNGAAAVAQLGVGGATISTIGQFLSGDNWAGYNSQVGKISTGIQNNVGAIYPPPGFSRMFGLGSNDNYAPIPSDYIQVYWAVDGINTIRLKWGTAGARPIKLLFYSNDGAAGTYSGSVRNDDASRSFPFAYTCTAGEVGTWVIRTISIPGCTDGTWLTTEGTVGLRINLAIGVGSDYLGVAGAWVSANKLGTTGSTQTTATSGLNRFFTGVDAYADDYGIDRPFPHKTYTEYLRECQQYLRPCPLLSGMLGNSATTVQGPVPFCPPMAKAPTGIIQPSVASISDEVAFAATQSATGGSLQNASVNGTRLQLTNFTGITTNKVYGTYVLNLFFDGRL